MQQPLARNHIVLTAAGELLREAERVDVFIANLSPGISTASAVERDAASDVGEA